MKAIHVDFAPRTPQRVIASMRTMHWLLVAIGVVMGVTGIVALGDLTQQQNKRSAELERLQAQATVRSAPAEDIGKKTISEAQASAVNSTIQQLNLPWNQLLSAIEHATPTSVAMLELELDAKRHFVRGLAETETPAKMLAYIQRLKQEPFLGNVTLTKHEISEDNPLRPIRFEFEAEWRESGK